MYILGISAYYHDSAASIIKDGKVLVAMEEERFTRIKHDNQFPFTAIRNCLKTVNLSIDAIDYISYYEKPLLKLERILDTFVQTYPFALKAFLKGIPEWLDYKIKVEHTIKTKLKYKGKIFFIPHHLSHASACFYPSPFQKAAVLTVDGTGEYQTTALWYGRGSQIKPLKSINFPNSLGLLYSTFTSFLGFKINEDEYKVMGLSAYGKPTFVNRVNTLIQVKKDGSYKLNMDYFSFRENFSMWNKRFEKLFGKPRLDAALIQQRHRDIAASIQQVTENIYFKMLNHLYDITKTKNLCIGGGVALNALANGKIYSRTPFKNIYIFGAASDSGSAIGAALFTFHSILGNPERIPIKDLYLGSQYSNQEIEQTIKCYPVSYRKFSYKNELIIRAAQLLAGNQIIGWFQDKMEFGPRALGARSILAKPNPRTMKTKMNIIKKREQFRPFAGSILQEKVDHYFEVPQKKHWAPFMTFCFNVKKGKINELTAIVHKDNTCRIQTVNKEAGMYYKLIKKFYQLTGIPCILNTSFNLKGEPIVENPQQAMEDFLKTKLKYLVIGDFLVKKS